MMNGMYGSIGVMMLVHESPIRNTAWVASGVNPSRMNIGTNTGAMIAHFAEADVMSRLMAAANATNAPSSGAPCRCTAFRKSAPVIATIAPRFDHAK